MEHLHREIEKLKIERIQLEFHVERTGTGQQIYNNKINYLQ